MQGQSELGAVLLGLGAVQCLLRKRKLLGGLLAAGGAVGIGSDIEGLK